MELSGVSWKVEETRDRASFRWGRIGADYVAEWHGVLTLRAGPDGSAVAIEKAAGAQPDLIEKTQNGIARAFVRSIVGRVSLHASAVTDGRMAVLLIGSSGAGKSTMASNLCQLHGFRLLADDVAAVDFESGFWVVPPTESKVWLTPNGSWADAGKHPIAASTATTAARLGLVLALDFDDFATPTEPTPLRGAEAVARVTRAAIRFESTPQSMTRELEVTAALLAQAPVLAFTRSCALPARQAAELVANALEQRRGRCAP